MSPSRQGSSPAAREGDGGDTVTDGDELAVTAAQQYYGAGRTMAAIARDLKMSRSSISRLLSRAREIGLVEIRVLPPGFRVESLETRLQRRFGVRACVVAVAEGTPEEDRYARTARVGAELVAEHMGADAVLAVSWGTMVNAISHQLSPKPCTNSWIVQTNGVGQSTSGTHHSVGILERFSTAFGASIQQLSFPIFLDSESVTELIEQEQLMRHVRTMIAGADIFLFNVGTVQEGHPNRPWLNGHFLGEKDFRRLREDGAVGDVATTFIADDGTSADIGLNARSTGPDLESIRDIRHRICVTSGNHKVRALEAALHGGLVTDLVIDEITAGTLLG